MLYKTFKIYKMKESERIENALIKSSRYVLKKNCAYITSILFILSSLSVYGQVSADSALKCLKEGNKRFATQKSNHPNQTSERIKEVEAKQKPFAIIVGCSDSRVPSEIIFDQGLGDLFIVRTAGQVSSYASWGSIEFANAVLGSKLIVVLGHTKCGAVSAACKLPEVPGHIITLINAIKPAAEMAKQMKGDTIENAVKINVALQVKQLQSLEPVLTKAIKNGDLKIVGAIYNLSSGIVEFLPENYLELIKN